MKNKQNLTSKERKDYLFYKLKTIHSDFFIMVIFFIIITWIIFQYFIPNIEKFNQFYIKLCYFAFFALIIIIKFLISKTFKVLFFKNIYSLNGHVFKTHTFIGTHHGSDQAHTTTFKSMARAISEDGGTTTKWLYYPKSFFKKGNAKVKLIIYKDKAIDFYIVD